ncbi:LptA/OstA family protein, partial [Pseudomonas viridiflava]
IQYHAQQNRIVLIDQAKVLSADGNSTEGEKIVYNTKTQVAQAGRANGNKVTAPRPRIDMVIQPKKKAE